MKGSRPRTVIIFMVVFVFVLGTVGARKSSGSRSGGSSRGSGGSKSRTSGSSDTYSGASYQHRERDKQSGSGQRPYNVESSGAKTGVSSQSRSDGFIRAEGKSYLSSDLDSYLGSMRSRMNSNPQHLRPKQPKTTYNSTNTGYRIPYQHARSGSNHYRKGNNTQHVNSTVRPYSPAYRSNTSSSHNSSMGSSSNVSKVASVMSNAPSAPAEVSGHKNPLGTVSPLGWKVPVNAQNYHGLPTPKPSAPEQPLGSQSWANPHYSPQNPNQPQSGNPGSVPNQFPQQNPQGNSGYGVHYPAGQGALPAGSYLSGQGALPAGSYPSGQGALPAGPYPSGLGSLPAGSYPSGLGSLPAGSYSSGQGALPAGSYPSGQGALPAGSYPSGQGSLPAGSYPLGQGALPGGNPVGLGAYPGQNGFPQSGMTGVDPNLGRYGTGNYGYPQSSYGQGGVPQHSFQTYPGSSNPGGIPVYPGQVPYQGNNGYQGYNAQGGMSYPSNYGSYGANYYGKPNGGGGVLGKVGAAAAGMAAGMVIQSGLQHAFGSNQWRPDSRYATYAIKPSNNETPVGQPDFELSSEGYTESTDNTPNYSSYSTEATSLAISSKAQ